MTQSESYRLTELERIYLVSGETGSYSEAELQERIQEKQDKVGSRLNSLISDLLYMYNSELHNFEDNNKNMFKSLALTEIMESLNLYLLRGDQEGSFHDPNWGRPVTTPKTPEEFGYLLGGLLRLLFKMVKDDQPWNKTLRGLFHFYLVGSGEKLSYEADDWEEFYRRYNKLKETVIFEQLEENMSEEDKSVLYTSDEYTYITKHKWQPKQTWARAARSVLQENGIPSDGILHFYLNDKYRMGSTTSFDWAKNKVESKFSELMEDDRFKNTIGLYKCVTIDKNILEKEWRGPNRIDIMLEIGRKKQRIKSNKIAKNLDQSSSAHLVTNALKRMSFEIDESERWTSYPATKEHNDGWQLSPYGRALGLLIIGCERTIERYACSDVRCWEKEYADVVSGALGQINET